MTTTTHDIILAKLPVVGKFPKARTLSAFLRAMGVLVDDVPKREHVEQAHRIFRGARGHSVEINNLWNIIKRHVCPVCDGVKLKARMATCSVTCGWKLRKAAALVTILLASTMWSNAAQVVLGTQMSTTTTISSPLGLITVPPLKQSLFTWDAQPEGTSNKVYWGTVRGYWTNGSAVINTNVFPYTNGSVYKVTGILAGVESPAIALWPSNRVAGYWLKDMGTNFFGARMITNETLLVTYTNNPSDGKHAWQIEDRTIRME